jgi:hypothetical protein
VTKFMQNDALHLIMGGGWGEPTKVHRRRIGRKTGVKGISAKIGPRGTARKTNADGSIRCVVKDEADIGIFHPLACDPFDTLMEARFAFQKAHMEHTLMGGPDFGAQPCQTTIG